MTAREILLLGDPRLWEPSLPVVDPRGIGSLVEDLGATLAEFRAEKGFGRAIAAPQIGVARRVVFVRVQVPMVFVNPVIVRRSVAEMELWDDCLSFPDLLVRVRRHESIAVEYSDEQGAAHRLDVIDPSLAELLQHEIDHLDGVLATDRAVDPRAFRIRRSA